VFEKKKKKKKPWRASHLNDRTDKVQGLNHTYPMNIWMPKNIQLWVWYFFACV